MIDATSNGKRRTSRFSSARLPTITHERAAWKAGYDVVAGVDEAGRGAWAGPLVAAAVVLPKDPQVRARLTRTLNRAGLQPRDSKLLSPETRIEIVEILTALAIPQAVIEVAPATVDECGVGVANLTALQYAVQRLDGVDYALIDAFRVESLTCNSLSIVGGDGKCLSIALASIVAKTHRDAIMQRIDRQFPGYGFAQHKGYGTRAHAEALARLGPCSEHRLSFKPVADTLVRV